MGERVSDDITIRAPQDVVWDVITDMEAYPDWAEGMESAEVLETDERGRPIRVRFEVDAKVFRIGYTLSYAYGDDNLTWSLVEGDQVTQLDGEYLVQADGDGTYVKYTLEADFAIHLPGFLKKRGAKRILDTGLRGLKQRSEARA